MTEQRVDEEPTKPWEPGIPLYDRGQHPHSLYLFNYRDDSENEHCTCTDAADWPAQARRPLPHGDEIGNLIDAVRADRGLPPLEEPDEPKVEDARRPVVPTIVTTTPETTTGWLRRFLGGG